jgi:hypothetical protein
MQNVAFTKRVQKLTTELLNSTQINNYFIVMIHGVKNVCMYPELTEHVPPPFRYVGNFDNFLTPMLPIWYLLLNSYFRC